MKKTQLSMAVLLALGGSLAVNGALAQTITNGSGDITATDDGMGNITGTLDNFTADIEGLEPDTIFDVNQTNSSTSDIVADQLIDSSLLVSVGSGNSAGGDLEQVTIALVPSANTSLVGATALNFLLLNGANGSDGGNGGEGGNGGVGGAGGNGGAGAEGGPGIGIGVGIGGEGDEGDGPGAAGATGGSGGGSTVMGNGGQDTLSANANGGNGGNGGAGPASAAGGSSNVDVTATAGNSSDGGDAGSSGASSDAADGSDGAVGGNGGNGGIALFEGNTVGVEAFQDFAGIGAFVQESGFANVVQHGVNVNVTSSEQ